MGSYFIIDARTEKIRASLDSSGPEVVVYAIDLIADTWDDFVYFAKEARVSDQEQDLMRRYRCVRAAMAALFSHFDGIISNLFDMLSNDSAFRPYRPKKGERTLTNRAKAIHKFLAEHRELSHVEPDLSLKLLRDVLSHPKAVKNKKSGSPESLPLDAIDLYEVGVEELGTVGHEINEWLNAICAAVPYERFPDTKSLAEKHARLFGDGPGASRF